MRVLSTKTKLTTNNSFLFLLMPGVKLRENVSSRKEADEINENVPRILRTRKTNKEVSLPFFVLV